MADVELWRTRLLGVVVQTQPSRTAGVDAAGQRQTALRHSSLPLVCGSPWLSTSLVGLHPKHSSRNSTHTELFASGGDGYDDS